MKLLGLSSFCSYKIFDLPRAVFPAFLTEFMQDPKNIGLNITTPFKTSVAKLLPAGNPSVAVGNTLYRRGGIWYFTCTDGPAFIKSVCALGAPIKAYHDLIFLGNGGVVEALLREIEASGYSGRIHVLRRSPARDEVLEKISSKNPISFYEFTPEELRQACTQSSMSLCVQATNAPHKGDDLKWLGDGLENFRGTFFDLAYRPASALLGIARSLGCRGSDGMGMLFEQAFLAQELWWGKCGRGLLSEAELERHLQSQRAMRSGQ